jgi:hypothetical protein
MRVSDIGSISTYHVRELLTKSRGSKEDLLTGRGSQQTDVGWLLAEKVVGNKLLS